MGTAPLNRDKQIEMMANAKERYDVSVARWAASRQVRDVLALAPVSGEKSPREYLRRDEKLVRCG